MKQWVRAAFMVLCFSIVGGAQDSTQTGLTENGTQTGEIQISAFVDKTKVPLNRFVELFIRLEWKGNLDKYEIHKFDNPIVNNFEIVGNSSSNKVMQVGGENKAVQNYKYTLKPTTLGMGYIEGMIIKYTDLDTDRDYRLTTNRLSIEIEEPIPEPKSKSWIFILLGVVLFLMLLGLSLGIWLKRRKEKRVAQEQTKIANIPTEEKYISELRTIDLNDPEVEINTTISRLSNLLRRYLAEKFQAPGLQSTTEDVVKYLETREIDDWGVEKTSEILSTADLIKFSGGVGDKTQLDRIYTLVESILHRYQENKIEEGENKESDKG